jgi:hypothetical protein
VGRDAGLKARSLLDPELGWQLVLEVNQFLFQFKYDIWVDVASRIIINDIIALIDDLNEID